MSSSRVDRHALIAASAVFVATACAATGSLIAWHGPEALGAPQRFTELPLLDQDGRSVTLSKWLGKIVVIDFIYTGCGDTCPLRTAEIAEAQRRLPADLARSVQFVSVSVDPEHDDPAALRAYADRYGAGLGNWAFLTGNLGDVARFAAFFNLPASSETDPPSHVTTLSVLDRDGAIARLLVGPTIDPLRLLGAITELAPAHLAGNPSAPSARLSVR